MAKKRSAFNTELPPGVEPQAPASAEPVEKPSKSATRKASVQPKPDSNSRKITIRDMSVSVPLLDGIEGYTKRRVDVVFKTSEQAQFWKQATAGLLDRGAKLKNGKYVQSIGDTIKWVAENASV